MGFPWRVVGSRIWHSTEVVGEHLLAIVTSRSVVVICSTCAILYAGFWGVAVLQANGLIHTSLPIPVADSVVLRRGGGQLRPTQLSSQEAEQRNQALAQSQTAPGDASTVAPGESPFTLEVQAAQPAELWVTDDQGGEVGTNPDTGLVRLQLTDASYSGRGSSPQLVSIPHAFGQYHIQLLGTDDGQFQLTVRAFRDQDVDHAVQFSGTGEVFADTLLETLANVGQQDDGTPTLGVSPVQVLVVGNAPAQVAGVTTEPPPAPSSAPASSAPASPAPPPFIALPVPPAAPVVVRPRPAAQPPIPLPPILVLPVAVPNPPSASPSPSPSASDQAPSPSPSTSPAVAFATSRGGGGGGGGNSSQASSGSTGTYGTQLQERQFDPFRPSLIDFGALIRQIRGN